MKKSFLKLYIILITIFFCTHSFSFDKQELTKSVLGRVLDERNFPVSNVKVILGGNEVETYPDGSFGFQNITFPYDIIIAERSTATAIIYKNLSIDNPELILLGLKHSIQNTKNAVIKVNLPDIPAGSSAIIKFISTDVFFCEDAEVSSGEKIKTLSVDWPESKKILNGKVIYIQKNNLGYQVFKNITVNLYVNTASFEVSFKGNLKANTLSSEVIIYLPFDDYKVKGYSVFADFFAYNRNSEIMLTREEGNIFRTKSIIPLKLPISYRIKVSGFVDYDDGSGFINYTYTKPGAVVNLTTESPPKLQTPSDKLLGANGNTGFSYTLGSGTGIFVIQLHSLYPNMNFYIVTNENNSNLSYLSRTEFRNANSVEFKWSVKKYLTYFSVNDFVKPKEFNNDIGYKAVLYSSERTFKTGYF